MTPLLERFQAKVQLDAESGCQLWTGAHMSAGYGLIKVAGAPRLAHRVSYELTHGVIPAGLVIDHTCNTRTCVNPAHLRAVTTAANVAASPARAERCWRGHARTADNTGTSRRGHRVCLECRRFARAARQFAAETRRWAAHLDAIQADLGSTNTVQTESIPPLDSLC